MKEAATEAAFHHSDVASSSARPVRSAWLYQSLPGTLRSGSSSNGGGHILQSKLRPKPGQTSPVP